MADLDSILDDLEFLQQIEDSMINYFQNPFENQKHSNPEEAEQDPQDSPQETIQISKTTNHGLRK